MWLLWILTVLSIFSSSLQNNRYQNTEVAGLEDIIRHYAFKTEFHLGTFEITSVTGGEVTDNNAQTTEFDKEFPTRAFEIGFPTKDDKIIIEMSINGKMKDECFNFRQFQLACLCYQDNVTSSTDRFDKWQNAKGGVINYCGKKQSMICFDYFRNPAVVSSNPTILKEYDAFKDNGKYFVNVPGTQDTGDSDIHITLTFKKSEPTKVYVSVKDQPERSITIVPFKAKWGYEFGNSEMNTIISVLPFQIFDPLCQVKWKFINGKPLEYPNSNPEFETFDSQEYFVVDKHTVFKKPATPKKDAPITSAASESTKMSLAFIGFVFFYTSFL